MRFHFTLLSDRRAEVCADRRAESRQQKFAAVCNLWLAGTVMKRLIADSQADVTNYRVVRVEQVTC